MSLSIYPEIVRDMKLVSVPPTATVYMACQRMVENQVGAVVVLSNGALVGIFTERDLLNEVVVKNLDTKKVKVEDVMTDRPETIFYKDDAFKALEMMNLNNYRHLPVVDERGKVMTVLSIRDLYKIVESELQFRIRQRESFIFGSAYGAMA